MKLNNKELKMLLDGMRLYYDTCCGLSEVEQFDIGMLYAKLHTQLLFNESKKVKEVN